MTRQSKGTREVRCVPKRRSHRQHEGMTLIELIVVVVIVALAASGLSISLGALTKTNLKSGADKLAAAARFAYNRAIIRGEPGAHHVRRPGRDLHVEEANEQRGAWRASDDERRKDTTDQTRHRRRRRRSMGGSQQPHPGGLKPTLGASPFQALADDDGKPLSRYSERRARAPRSDRQADRAARARSRSSRAKVRCTSSPAASPNTP